MARGKRTDPRVISMVQTMWAGDPKLRATDIHNRLKSKVTNCPRLRSVQMIIRDAKRRATPIPDDPPLQPWGADWPESPEDIKCLYRLMACRFFERSGAVGLTTRHARWALKLRGVFDVTGLDPAREYEWGCVHLTLALSYSWRERAAETLGEAPYTADLDAVLMFRPWESGGESYRELVRHGLIPPWLFETDLEAGGVIAPGASERWQQFLREVAQVGQEGMEGSHARHHKKEG
jgi:hypothetical protein